MNVLIVDDNADHRHALQLLLRALGHQVMTAPDGPRGLLIAATFAPQVVFLDLQMPLMSGYEVARELRRHPATAASRLILMSGSDSVTLGEARGAGCTAVLRKPASLSAILAALHAGDSSEVVELAGALAQGLQVNSGAGSDTVKP